MHSGPSAHMHSGVAKQLCLALLTLLDEKGMAIMGAWAKFWVLLKLCKGGASDAFLMMCLKGRDAPERTHMFHNQSESLFHFCLHRLECDNKWPRGEPD